MNADELIWNGKRVTALVQQTFLECLKKHFGGGVTAGEASQNSTDSALPFYNVGQLRMNGVRKSGAICIGSSNAEFLSQFGELVNSSGNAENPLESKTVETDLLKALFQVLDPELKANQINVDPSSVFSIPAATLGCWEKIAVDRTVLFPFAVGAHEIVLEVPVFDAELQAKMTNEFYGYRENARILVVDDSATTRKLSRHYLSLAGYLNLDESPDGQAAFTKLQSSRPPFDLVVCDWHMPNMTGLELLKKVRVDAQLASLPFILATGERNAEEVTLAIKSGVSGYVMKPYDALTLYKAIKKSSILKQVKKAA